MQCGKRNQASNQELDILHVRQRLHTGRTNRCDILMEGGRKYTWRAPAGPGGRPTSDPRYSASTAAPNSPLVRKLLQHFLRQYLALRLLSSSDTRCSCRSEESGPTLLICPLSVLPCTHTNSGVNAYISFSYSLSAELLVRGVALCPTRGPYASMSMIAAPHCSEG